MRDQNSKVEELKETLPSEPTTDPSRKSVTFHGVIYAFPDWSEDQIQAMVKEMEKVNKSGKYSMLNNLLERLAPFRVRRTKRRRPGKRVKREKPIRIAKK